MLSKFEVVILTTSSQECIAAHPEEARGGVSRPLIKKFVTDDTSSPLQADMYATDLLKQNIRSNLEPRKQVNLTRPSRMVLTRAYLLYPRVCFLFPAFVNVLCSVAYIQAFLVKLSLHRRKPQSLPQPKRFVSDLIPF